MSILKALYDYYYRSGDLAPHGTEYKEIAFAIVIDEEGNFLRLEDLRIDKKRCQQFLVIKGSRSSNVMPYLFWDNVEYVLNYTKYHVPLSDKDAQDQKKVDERAEKIAKSEGKHRAMIKRYQEIANQFPSNKGFRAVCAFYAQGQVEKVYEHELWAEIVGNPNVNLSFRLQGAFQIVAEAQELRNLIATDDNAKRDTHICLVTGEPGELVESTTPTPIPGGQATARLVSFQGNSGYDSYGKRKCFNSPISKEAEAAYTTALKTLLGKDSRNRFFAVDRTFVFWASSMSEGAMGIENCIADIFSKSPSSDDADAVIENVNKVFKATYSGELKTDLDDRFFILGLAPNAARIAVVYWREIPLKDFAGNVLRHFDDMEIVDTRNKRKPYYGLYNILYAITLEGDVSKAQRNLPEAIIKSILEGLPYPYALYTACLRRIRSVDTKRNDTKGKASKGKATQDSNKTFPRVTIAQAAILKAYLNRINHNHKPLTVMLDKENTNSGYLCGRLFAILERIQEKANGTSNVATRYMNAASATPAAVFPTLMNLSIHHIEKLDGGLKVYYEKLKGEVVEGISSNGFPAHLDLYDQGRFMVGYYHQRQEFFRRKEADNSNE